MKKAFTLIELIVAVALLVIVLLFAGTIFKVSIGAYRVAVANAEMMQKLRAITDQLNADFKGLRKDTPLLIWFEKDSVPNRYDQIMFFADGDFQSIQLYNKSPGEPDDGGDTLVRGNIARIHYGHAQSLDPADGMIKDPILLKDEDRLLARRRHILTTNFSLWPDPNDLAMTIFFDGRNEVYEHDRLSLAQWKIVDGIAYGKEIIPACFVFRPYVDVGDSSTFHKLLCEGVGSFAVQWAYWDSSNELSWFPETNTDFTANPFGIYFNIPGSISGWFPGGDIPPALKFTFRLYDSKGIIKEGRTFTHIVYLDSSD